MHSGGYAAIGNVKLPPPPPVDSLFARWIYNEALWFYADESAEDLLIKKMIAHQVWLEPTLTVEEILPSREQYKNDPGLKFSLTTYNEYEAGWPTLTSTQKDSMLLVFKKKQLFVKKFYDAGGLVLAGTDNLYGSSLHKELELLTGAGLSPAAALKIATYNNAKALGWLDQLGTVSKGKRANLVLLDKNPLENISNSKAINTVIINGRVLDRKKLDDLIHEASVIVSKYKGVNEP
jgi:imidazolonepropionase-like amidohydrolase